MRKGQAAMEFLMTYGWAILIVIAVVAALFAMGVFKLPTGGVAPCSPCFAPATGIAYKDHGAKQISIINGRANDINITRVIADGNVDTFTPPIKVAANEDVTLNLTNIDLSAKPSTQVTIEYIDLETGIAHNATATLHGA